MDIHIMRIVDDKLKIVIDSPTHIYTYNVDLQDNNTEYKLQPEGINTAAFPVPKKYQNAARIVIDKIIKIIHNHEVKLDCYLSLGRPVTRLIDTDPEFRLLQFDRYKGVHRLAEYLNVLTDERKYGKAGL